MNGRGDDDGIEDHAHEMEGGAGRNNNGRNGKKKVGRPRGSGPVDPARVSKRGIPVKMDPRVQMVLNSLADWLNDYQYRIVMKIVCREARRLGATFPPHKMEALESMEALLEIGPEDYKHPLKAEPSHPSRFEGGGD